MITDHDLALASQAAYSGTPTWATRDVQAYLTVRPEGAIVAFRGTADIVGLLRDLEAALIVHGMADHIDLGPTPESFLADVLEIYPLIVADLPPDIDVFATGHSKGAAEAEIFAALLLQSTGRNVSCSVFAPPRVGRLNGILASMPGRSYRNRIDPVTEVPLLPHPRAITAIDVMPPELELGPLADHHVSLYVRGVETPVAAEA